MVRLGFRFQVTLDSTSTMITLTPTTGASPDDDDGSANGVIVDSGGPAIPSAVIPEYPLGLPLLAIFMLVGYGLTTLNTLEAEKSVEPVSSNTVWPLDLPM